MFDFAIGINKTKVEDETFQSAIKFSNEIKNNSQIKEERPKIGRSGYNLSENNITFGDLKEN